MDRARLRELVVAGLKEEQRISGRAWKDLPDHSNVVNVLEGFDSIAGIETTSIIEGLLAAEKPGCTINAETLFVDGRRALTLSESVDALEKAIAGA